MIRPQLSLDLYDELLVDNFAGGGGASTGIELGLGRGVDFACNHDPEACFLHATNHPQTRHYCEDVFKVDPVEVTGGRPVGVAWFSPDCKHFSKAKGGKPKSKKIRGLAWVMVKWAAKVAPRVMILENVEEFQDWGPLLEDGSACPKRKGKTFRNFVARLRNLGYVVEWKELRACDYGAPTIRRRLFLVARRDGQAIAWPEPTHGNPKSAEVRRKRLKPWRTAAECIDFSLPCHSLFLTPAEARAFHVRRPLAVASCRRVAKGVERYVMNADDPFLVSVGAAPFLTEHANASVQRNFPVNEPLRTQCAQVKGGHFAVVAPMIARQFGTAIGRPVTEPAATCMTGGGGGKSQLIGTFLAQNNTGVIGHSMNEPVSTLTQTGSHQSLVAVSMLKYYGTDQDPKLREPMHTGTTKERFGLSECLVAIPPLTPELAVKARRVAAFLREHGVEFQGEFATTKSGLVIYDIGMRMLTPRELFNAQGFPQSYIIDPLMDGKPLSKTAQVRMCGNSVCPPVAAALVRANVPEMAAWGEGEERKVA